MMRDIMKRLLRIERTVASLADAVEFYCSALGFRVAESNAAIDPAWAAFYPGRSVQAANLRLGSQTVLLTAFDPPGLAYPKRSHSYDRWFQHFAIVTPDIGSAYQALQTYEHLPITQGEPVLLPASTGGVSAYKFRDSDGHPLEFLQFPPGIGNPLWQKSSSQALAIGIDHSAISVSDTETSVDFYRRLLGMKLAARQINRGTAQERLDNVPNAEVDVVALNPTDEAMPHLELLGYHNIPRGEASIGWKPWDITGDRLVFEVDDLSTLLTRPEASGCILCYSADARAALIRDPDGHLLILTQTG